MMLFSWLKGKSAVENVTPSALAQMLDASAVVLPTGAVLVKTYPEAERIALSLRDYPEDWRWEQKGYRLQHVPSGFRMWVANGESHLAECTEGTDIKFSPGEQAVIWREVQQWIDSFKVGFSGRLPKVKITARRGTYWCVADGHPWAGAGNSPVDAYRSWARAVSIQARKDNTPDEFLHVWSDPL